MAAITSLRPGDEVAGVYACTRKDRLLARTGTPYLALELRDRTGALPGRAFKDADVLAGRFDRGELVRVRGRVERFRDELQVEVLEIARAEGADPAEFLPVAYRNVDELDGFLEHLAREVHDPAYARAAGAAARRRRAAAEWRRAPCTRNGHHAYLGGLLEHTVAVGTLALETCVLHPRLNSDLLMTAALVHDLGKTREFTYGAEIGLSEEGRLLGHVVLGQRLLDERSAGMDEGGAWRSRTASCATTGLRRAGRGVRLAGGARLVPPQCAGCECEGRVGARPDHNNKVRRHVHHSVRPSAAASERRRGARRIVQGRSTELRDARGLRARRRVAAEHHQHADHGVDERQRVQPRRRDNDVSTGTAAAGQLLDSRSSASCSPRSPRPRASARCRAPTWVRSPTVGESLSFAASRVVPLIWLSILYVLGLIIPFLLLILPGIWLSVAWSVSYPALLAEGLGAGRCARRSFKLSRGRWWPTFGALLVMYLIVL